MSADNQNPPQWPGDPETALLSIQAALNGQRQGQWVKAPCPIHQGRKRNLGLRVKEGRIYGNCWSKGCKDSLGPAAFYAQLEQITGVRFSPGTYEAPNRTAPAPPPARKEQAPETLEKVEYARSLWESSRPIPPNAGHPARLWLGRRNLWRPEFPLPSSLKWLPRAPQWAPQAAGCVIAPAAPPEQWILSWPAVPPPQGVQRIPVMADGSPAGEKKSNGALTGCVFVIGDPNLKDAEDPTSVTEGIADSLAVASRQPGTAVSTLGTSGMTAAGANGLAEWLAGSPTGILIWADRDEGKNDMAPTGLKAANRLADHVRAAKSPVHPKVIHAAAPHKDAAEAAAHNPFPQLDRSFADYAGTLRQIRPASPRWQIALASDLATRET